MAIAKNPKVIMTSEQFITRLKNLAGRKTFYKNKYPYNLCYINKDGRTSADCVNLVKALLNGYNIYNNTVGYYQKDLSNTGDCTEAELLAQCSEVSTNFTNMPVPAILYMKGHIGTYIGNCTVNGKEYNVIEATKSFGGGIVYSWVDADGTRRACKGGLKNGGKPDKWVSYGAQEGPTTPEKPKDYKTIAKEVIDGKWGNGAARTNKLKQAGYTDEEIKEIQRLVNEMLKPSKEVWHTVKSGEVASGIAKKYGVTMAQLKKLNPSIKNWNVIYPNQKIRVK